MMRPLEGLTGKASWVFLLLVLVMPRAHADPQEVEEGEPITIEDATTNDVGELSLQYSGTYTRIADAGTQALLEQGPTFKLGVFKDVQVSLNPYYGTGSAPGHNSGVVLSDVKVQLNQQTIYIPTLAVDVFYGVPFGAGDKSANYIFRAVASKLLGSSEDSPTLHLNLTDTHLSTPDFGGRKDQLQAVFGGSFLIARNAALVGDVVYGAAEEAGRDATFVEVGYSRDLPHDWKLEVGVGRQVDGDTWEVFLSIEKEVQIF